MTVAASPKPRRRRPVAGRARLARVLRGTLYVKLGLILFALVAVGTLYLRLSAGPLSFAGLPERVAGAIAARIGPGWTVNGSTEHRYHGNLNIHRSGLDAARLLANCRQIAFSLGSACASGSGRPSHVLRALGLNDREARQSIRLGFGRYTTEAELIEACTLIRQTAEAQQRFAA